ncbi:DUF302 domain-containing protein [Streptomyces sp. NPDC026672]|uniref:DUF302 domain-containing protein n=1 Tax=unclassified Streptomyces TaxID=2593676 RepID=UPI0033EC7733
MTPEVSLYQARQFHLPVHIPYGQFIKLFETLVPDVEPKKLAHLIAAGDMNAVSEHFSVHAPNGWSVYWKIDIGPLQRLNGHDTTAVTYLLGNSLIGESLFRHDPAALTYAPFRVTVSRDGEGRTTLTIVQPSTQLNSLNSPHITRIGHEVDTQIAHLLRRLGLTPPDEMTRQ